MPMNMKRTLTVASSLVLGASLMSGHALAGSDVDYTKMSPKQLAEYLIFDKEGFELGEKTQEGGTVRDRLKQDKLQTLCSAVKGQQPDGDTVSKVTAMAQESIEYPEGGVSLGDWRKGQKIALNAFGYRVGHKVDDHSTKTPGGLCINCHVMDPEGDMPGGSLGPSLEKYGKTRGQSEAMLKYAYEVIYNPHSKFPCSKMPRIGANGVLDPQQIRHVMAYLLDPDSPVNK